MCLTVRQEAPPNSHCQCQPPVQTHSWDSSDPGPKPGLCQVTDVVEGLCLVNSSRSCTQRMHSRPAAGPRAGARANATPSPTPPPFHSLPSPFVHESQPPATSLQKSESCLGSREMGPAACETADMRYEEWEMREQRDTHARLCKHSCTHARTNNTHRVLFTDRDYSGMNGARRRQK